jgi:sporulation protein YlmC with PRC-barrel domain
MTKNKYLQELDHSNYEIVNGEPDIRGWDVRYGNGEKIGSVEELILDTKAKKIRYMVVDLDENELRLERRKVFIPIGFAELDDLHDDVLIPNVSVDQLCKLPDYKRNALTPELERSIASVFGRKVRVEPAATIERGERKSAKSITHDDIDPDFYSHDHYKDNLFKNRSQQTRRPSLHESEFDDGLRLLQKRNETEKIDTSDLTDAEREKLLKYRRELYRQRRYKNESV